MHAFWRRMHNSWRDGVNGRVYAYTEKNKLKIEEIMEGNRIGLPNGMAWHEGKNVMYFADTGTVYTIPPTALRYSMKTRPAFCTI